MKFSYNKILIAFTLAEIMIVFAVLSIITAVALNIVTPNPENLYRKQYYYAYMNLKNAVGELIAEGCSATDVSSGYCDSVKALPKQGYYAAATTRGFCYRLTEAINTVGTITCNATGATTSSAFLDANVNFISSNGLRFFNFNTTASSSTPYTIYVDMDGTNGNHTLGTDVFPFTVTTAGSVYPYYSSTDADASVGATSKDYMRARVTYTNGSGVLRNATYTQDFITDSVWDFRTATCLATGSYGGSTGNCSVSQFADCATYTCTVNVIKPADVK